MHPLLVAALGIRDFWFAFPLIIVISLVYAATRHEEIQSILTHALRIGIWITGFMVIVFLVLLLICWWV